MFVEHFAEQFAEENDYPQKNSPDLLKRFWWLLRATALLRRGFVVRQRARQEAELDRDHVRLKPVGVHVDAEEASLVQLDLLLPGGGRIKKERKKKRKL